MHFRLTKNKKKTPNNEMCFIFVLHISWSSHTEQPTRFLQDFLFLLKENVWVGVYCTRMPIKSNNLICFLKESRRKNG